MMLLAEVLERDAHSIFLEVLENTTQLKRDTSPSALRTMSAKSRGDLPNSVSASLTCLCDESSGEPVPCLEPAFTAENRKLVGVDTQSTSALPNSERVGLRSTCDPPINSGCSQETAATDDCWLLPYHGWISCVLEFSLAQTYRCLYFLFLWWTSLTLIYMEVTCSTETFDSTPSLLAVYAQRLIWGPSRLSDASSLLGIEHDEGFRVHESVKLKCFYVPFRLQPFFALFVGALSSVRIFDVPDRSFQNLQVFSAPYQAYGLRKESR